MSTYQYAGNGEPSGNEEEALAPSDGPTEFQSAREAFTAPTFFIQLCVSVL